MPNQSHAHEGTEFLRIPNEDGSEEVFEILFTFENDETGRKYMFVTPADAEENEDEYQEVIAFRYTEDDQGNLELQMIDEENEEEWDMVEETFNTLMADLED
ncbi:DUF1292 domain-containing protein [Lihuaxuella thermophila]|uniref:UPF0473 protein SAMN05444955_101314 n=1 Tax=Lihuaxuella thermophila TaxID=1173111 RepID=A0A1H8ATR4_9BACL|nr:DUF1292 domain-containing protein [Lihuaxuella thermophila]SEM73354.1 Uncharacterized protein YrzB, UPF0473 family [Lihuaxuella thermophila]